MGDQGGESLPTPVDSRGGNHVFKNGVWMAKGRVDRTDKFQKWAEGQIKSEVQRLDKAEHDTLVKLNSQCLEIRTELRGLKNERRLIQHRRHDSSDALEDADVTTKSPRSGAASSGLHKSSSFGSLTSFSSGYSSLGSATSAGRRSGGGGVEGVDRGAEGAASTRAMKSGSAAALRNLHSPAASASKVKKLTSARSVSKLNNNMEIFC